ncbi:glycosyltransferase family 2 protein [Vibrio sp. OPT10]|uniref:glycosyltransferase family 2 protein n=1 Tax=Vibrio sp. OPT10 TaxID=2778640 RepID=UPI00187F7ADD|nr:glycosyltransferase family 2 protein [Vibrio sp. OPT10]MBE8607851.1 glycosyltransferase family 2 protein [Vibrio sp. OPT10]
MSVFISVVSHGHGELIKKLSCLPLLAKHFSVVVKLNKKEDSLTEYLDFHGIHYIDEQYRLGFGNNNNIVYSYCENKLGMQGGDFFLVMNPDVISGPDSIEYVCQMMKEDNSKIASVNLFKDKNYKIPDNSIRNFPSLLNFISSFVGFGNSSVLDRSEFKTSVSVDWAAGSFLMFQSEHYKTLSGFDEGYFMYCEDIDICYRSKSMNTPLIYYPEVKVLHLASHENRRILSKHFYWHVKSVIRFLLSKRNLIKLKSSV